ncbi:MAG: hypothetical protein R2731_06310 [Nocardioides sp.]
MTLVQDRPLPLLSSYVGHVRRHWRRLLATATLGAVIGGAIFFSLAPRYYATARVAASPQITFLSLDPENQKEEVVTLDTTAALLRSDYALGRISRAMGVSTSEAGSSMVISAKPGSRVLVLQVRADTRAQAVSGVDAATQSLLALQADTFSISRTRVRLLKKRISVLQNQLFEQVAEGAPAQNLFESVSVLEDRLDKAVATNNTDSIVIVRAQVVRYRPGQVEVFVSSGLTLGMLVGLLSTLVWPHLGLRRHRAAGTGRGLRLRGPRS